MFSSRLVWGTGQNRLMAALDACRTAGKQILDLTQSNPTQAGILYPANLLHAFTDARALHYDPDPRGLLFARQCVAKHVQCNVDQIVLTASTSEAYAWLFKLLCDPGDEVLVPRPSYPLLDYLAALDSVVVKQYPLRYHEGWWLDFEDLERAITPRTRALVLVNPNNPTGSYLKSNELHQLNALCRKHDLAIISDEVFSGYSLCEDSTRIATLVGNSSTLTFCLNGLSKLIGLPQMKLGWMIASGPRHEEALSKLELIADTYLSVGTPVQYALPSLLALQEDIQDQIRQRCATNLACLEANAKPLRVEGGWYATIEVPQKLSGEEWALHLLNEHGVLTQPGYFYDFDQDRYLVLSLLTEPGTFAEGTRRILAAITA